MTPRVLLIAEECNPEWVSVPLVGWSHASALRAAADVHVVTQVRNREALLRAGWVEGDDFTAIDSEAVAGPLWKLATMLRGGKSGGWTTATAVKSIAYYYFEHLVWKQFQEQLRCGAFDLVHRLTPLSPAIPGLLPKRCGRIGVPFVVGPLNGGVPWPAGFAQAQRSEREWLSKFRSWSKLLPGASALRNKASAIIVGGEHTYNQMPEASRHRCVYIPENGIDPERFSATRSGPGATPVRLVFVGRLVPLKGVDMLLESATRLVERGAVEISIIGEGPERERLEAMSLDLGIADHVTFHGWIEHTELADTLAQQDVLVLPSIREFGGGVVLEAMALGLVPVVIDYGGPRELLTPASGYTVPLGHRRAIIVALRDVLTGIADDPHVLTEQRIAARARVQDLFTWSAKAQQVVQVYDWVLGRRETRPDFGMPFHAAVTDSADVVQAAA